MSIDRIGLSFDSLPSVTIDGQKVDVKQAAKSGKGVAIANGSAMLVATKKSGGGYRIEISGDPKVLAKWKFKVRNARIDQVGHLGDRLIHAKASKLSAEFQLDQKFLAAFQKKAVSQLGETLRKSGLKGFKDQDIQILRRNGLLTPQFVRYLSNPKIQAEKRQQALQNALKAPPKHLPKLPPKLPPKGDMMGMQDSQRRQNMQYKPIPPWQDQNDLVHDDDHDLKEDDDI